MSRTEQLIIEQGRLANGETYNIYREPFEKEAFPEHPYLLYINEGREDVVVELFKTMIHAQKFAEGYALGKGTSIQETRRVNA